MNPPRNVGSVQDCRLRKDGFRNAFIPRSKTFYASPKIFSPTSTKYHYTAFFYKTQPFKPKIFHFLRLYMNKFFLFSQKAVPEFTKAPFLCRKIKRQKKRNPRVLCCITLIFLSFLRFIARKTRLKKIVQRIEILVKQYERRNQKRYQNAPDQNPPPHVERNKIHRIAGCENTYRARKHNHYHKILPGHRRKPRYETQNVVRE